MKKYFFFLISLLMATQGEALLSPFYQSTKEITELLSDPQFIEAFNCEKIPGVHPVTKIERTENGYRIFSPVFYLDVDIIYTNPGMPAPIIFEWNFHEAVPLEK
jgi:hypothetical protein